MTEMSGYSTKSMELADRYWEGRWRDAQQEIGRLRSALEAIASLTTGDPRELARRALDGVDEQSPCPDHPTGRMVDDNGKRICSTCGQS